jgi:hypothetical protein
MNATHASDAQVRDALNLESINKRLADNRALYGDATMMAASGLTQARPQQGTVARRPQTTAKGGDFLESTARYVQNLWTNSGISLNNPLTTPIIKAVPGYITRIWIITDAAGGAASPSAVAAGDAPFNVWQNIRVNDVSGYPIYVVDGFGTYVAVMTGAQAGPGPFRDLKARPSYSAIATTGNFHVPFEINFELADGVGSILSADQSRVFSMQLNQNPAATIYSTQPGTLPTLQVRVDCEYYGAPLSDPSKAPKALGTSVQWSRAQASNQVVSGANSGLIIPPSNLTGYLGTIIAIAYNSASPSVREDGWLTGSNDIELWIDNQMRLQETWWEVEDRMARDFETFGVTPFPTRPAGVLAYSFRNSMLPNGPTGLDNLALWEPTDTGTLAELKSGAWGTVTSGPDTINFITQRLYPAGALPEGIQIV